VLPALDLSEYGPDVAVNVIGERKLRQISLGLIGLAGKMEMPLLQTADILAHTTMRAPFDKLHESILALLKEKVTHIEIDCGPDSIRQIVSGVLANEEQRVGVRRKVHEISRMAGWGGWKIKPVPGGILIDSRNPKPVDLERMLATDPSIELTPPPHNDQDEGS